MKHYILLTSVILLLSSGAFGFPGAGDKVAATYTAATDPQTSYFGGAAWHNSQTALVVGVCTPIYEHFYALGNAQAGIGMNISGTAVYFIHPFVQIPLYVGPLVGGAVESFGPQDSPMTYLTAATGVVGVYYFKPGNNWGVWGAGRYNIELQTSNYKERITIGGGLFFNI